MEQLKSNTAVSGVDVGKHRLDMAVYGCAELGAADNTDEAMRQLISWLKARGVGRVGLEATGGGHCQTKRT